jgi:hypothetical protein
MLTFQKFVLLAALVAVTLGVTPKAIATGTEYTEEHGTMWTQDDNRFVRRITPFLGAIGSTLTGDSGSAFTAKGSYSAGGLVELGGSGILVLETGLMYRSMGAEVRDFYSSSSYTSDYDRPKFNLNYLTIPLNAKVYFSGQKGTSMYAKGGLMGSRLMSKNVEYRGTSTTQLGAVGVRDNELAWDLGLGVAIEGNKNLQVMIDATWMRGITTISTLDNTYNEGLLVAVGLAFNL